MAQDELSGPFFRVIYPLVLMVSDLSAATSKLREVVGVLKAPKFIEFVLFLQQAEVYGSGYLDDVDYVKFNQRNTMSHREQLVRDLKMVDQVYDLARFALKLQ